MKKSIVLIPLMFLSFKKDNTEPTYSFKETLTYWNYKLNLFEGIKNAVKNSDIQAKYATAIVDSISALEDEIKAQIVPQLPKRDTTKHK